MASATSLHDRINRISHWDVNVTDLERSKHWYEASTTLRVIARTSAKQSFPSLGISSGGFEGYMLKDLNLPRGSPMIHLVQWKTPTPVGSPYKSHANIGWYRIVPVVEDIEATREVLVNLGSQPFQPTTRASVRLNPNAPPLDYRVFTVHDPDGVALEFGDKLTPSHTIQLMPRSIFLFTSTH
jgi:catechol 2,3-dioxygenase-like lactoylglutathione lyase family enzyme